MGNKNVWKVILKGNKPAHMVVDANTKVFLLTSLKGNNSNPQPEGYFFLTKEGVGNKAGVVTGYMFKGADLQSPGSDPTDETLKTSFLVVSISDPRHALIRLAVGSGTAEPILPHRHRRHVYTKGTDVKLSAALALGMNKVTWQVAKHNGSKWVRQLPDQENGDLNQKLGDDYWVHALID